MHIVAISDMHGQLPDTPECDVLVIAGDVCPLWDHSRKYQAKWITGEFSRWLRDQPAKRIVGIAGNHDIITADALGLAPQLPWDYLLNSAIEIDGVTFWGSPMCPIFGHGWAWMNPDEALFEVWEMIPENVDVLVTHGPPLGACDTTFQDDRVGSETLRNRIIQVKPMLHICGHIHPGYGTAGIMHSGGTTLVANASVVDGMYKPVNSPLRFHLTKTPGAVIQLT